MHPQAECARTRLILPAACTCLYSAVHVTYLRNRLAILVVDTVFLLVTASSGTQSMATMTTQRQTGLHGRGESEWW